MKKKIKELENKIETIRAKKIQAIKDQEYENACNFRIEEKILISKLEDEEEKIKGTK